ncbi:MAG: hypothetical protein JXB04_10060 [Kiritimatiellae bacterium]|nr:hypothetical protein [Kiritimatiellia bacterium]
MNKRANILLVVWLLLGAGACAAAGATVVINVGSSRADSQLGFGWSRREVIQGRRARWVSSLEADAWFVPARITDMELRVTAAPMHLSWKRQNIGVFVNGCFAGEWLCPDSPEFMEYRLNIPARLLREGANQLTLRMGYRRRMRPDRRELALAVSEIILQPVEPAL